MASPKETEVRELIINELTELADLEPAAIKPEATLEGLGVDSLDLVELAQIIEERYGVHLEREDFKDITTLGSAMDAIVRRCVPVAA